jgi:hypothetical protein
MKVFGILFALSMIQSAAALPVTRVDNDTKKRPRSWEDPASQGPGVGGDSSIGRPNKNFPRCSNRDDAVKEAIANLGRVTVVKAEPRPWEDPASPGLVEDGDSSISAANKTFPKYPNRDDAVMEAIAHLGALTLVNPVRIEQNKTVPYILRGYDECRDSVDKLRLSAEETQKMQDFFENQKAKAQELQRQLRELD